MLKFRTVEKFRLEHAEQRAGPVYCIGQGYGARAQDGNSGGPNHIVASADTNIGRFSASRKRIRIPEESAGRLR